MKKIGDFLNSSLAKKGLLKPATSALVCFYADKWGNGRFKPISYSRGVLKVSVTSSSAASELQMDEEKLIDHLNSKFNQKQAIKSLRIINMN